MNRIKEIRTQNNIKQIELCRVLDISQATLSLWENNKYEPDNQSLEKIADFFNVSIDYILCRTDKADNADDFETKLKNDDFSYAMYNESGNLTDEQKTALLGMVDYFKRELEKKKKQDNEE